jgi:hypothetical protein
VLEDEEHNLEERKMKLFSYIVTHDAGFAPNPFWGYCTLACCKPTIRRTAQKGDWIVGLSRKAKGNKIIYAMQVERILTFAEYYRAAEFADKIPNQQSIKHKCGDNIYKPLRNGDFKQHRSKHKEKDKEHDLSGINVLISKKFYYFGSQAIGLPKELCGLKVLRGHRNRFSQDVIKKFLRFIAERRKGLCAFPTMWDKGDYSCKTGNLCGSS